MTSTPDHDGHHCIEDDGAAWCAFDGEQWPCHAVSPTPDHDGHTIGQRIMVSAEIASAPYDTSTGQYVVVIINGQTVTVKVEQLRTIAAALAPTPSGGDETQRWVDQVCHYRNLAIACGAAPPDMLNDSDRALCENWEQSERLAAEDGQDFARSRAENRDTWDEVDRLRAEVAALRATDGDEPTRWTVLDLALRRACDDAWADGEGARWSYIRDAEAALRESDRG